MWLSLTLTTAIASKQLQWQQDGKCLIDIIYGKLLELEDSLSKLKAIRSKTIQELEKLIVKAKAEEEDKKHGRNTKIANISGSSAATAGFILGTVGFGLSFAAFGASLGLTVAGAALGGAGGLTVAGTSVTKYVLDKKIFTEVETAFAKDRKATQEFLTAYEGIQSRVKRVDKLGFVKELLVKLFKSPLFNGCRKGLNSFGKNIIYDSVSAAKSLKKVGKASAAVMSRSVTGAVDAADAGKAVTVFKSLSCTGRVLHVGGFVASVVVLPLDIYTLVSQSISLHRERAILRKQSRIRYQCFRSPEMVK